MMFKSFKKMCIALVAIDIVSTIVAIVCAVLANMKKCPNWIAFIFVAISLLISAMIVFLSTKFKTRSNGKLVRKNDKSDKIMFERKK